MLSVTTAAVHQPMCPNTAAQNGNSSGLGINQHRYKINRVNILSKTPKKPKPNFLKNNISRDIEVPSHSVRNRASVTPDRSESSTKASWLTDESTDQNAEETTLLSCTTSAKTENQENQATFRPKLKRRITDTVNCVVKFLKKSNGQSFPTSSSSSSSSSAGAVTPAPAPAPAPTVESDQVVELISECNAEENLYNGQLQMNDQEVQNGWPENESDNWDTMFPPEPTYHQIPEEDLPHYMTGFPNPPGENRCWLNATLHTLFVLPLIDYLDQFTSAQWSKLTKLLIAMQVFWKKGPAEREKTYSVVKKFKEELAVLDESYPSQKQQDVSEFLMIFLNYVKSECENFTAPVKLSDAPEINSRTLSPTKRPPLACLSPSKAIENTNDSNYKASPIDNPINQFFLLHMKENYDCPACREHRERDIDNLMLYVDLPSQETGTIDLSQAINKTMEPEERSLTCNKCKYTKHDVSTTFKGSPSVLIVQINRYAMTSTGLVEKVNTAVSVPEELVIENKEDAESPHRFEPVGLISHVGTAMDCGHYTSYVQHENQWFHYNDMDVTPMQRQEALSAAETTVYLVFFVNVKLSSSLRLDNVTLNDPLR